MISLDSLFPLAKCFLWLLSIRLQHILLEPDMVVYLCNSPWDAASVHIVFKAYLDYIRLSQKDSNKQTNKPSYRNL